MRTGRCDSFNLRLALPRLSKSRNTRSPARAVTSSAISRKSEHHYGCPSRDADVLLPVDRIRHRSSLPTETSVEVPQQLSRLRIGGDKGSAAVPVENEAARGTHQSALQNPAFHRHFPGDLTALEVKRA